MSGDQLLFFEEIFKAPKPSNDQQPSGQWSKEAAQDTWSKPDHNPGPGPKNSNLTQYSSAKSRSGEHLPAFEGSPQHGDRSKRQNELIAIHPVYGQGSAITESQLQAKIADVASHAAGKQMYLPREGSLYKGYHIDPIFGCTSASTNLLFDGLRAAGRVSASDYRNVHQIANERAYTMLQKEHLAKPVSSKEIQPGDWVYFKDKGESSGHSGVVFRDKKGELMVANNTSGKMMADSLKEMIDEYDTTRALRPILSPEKQKQIESQSLIADTDNLKNTNQLK